MFIGTLSLVGIAAGVDQLRIKSLKLGLFATSISSLAFFFNLYV